MPRSRSPRRAREEQSKSAGKFERHADVDEQGQVGTEVNLDLASIPRGDGRLSSLSVVGAGKITRPQSPPPRSGS